MSQGMLTTLTDTVTTAVTINNLIHNIDPMEIPKISYFKLTNEKAFALRDFPNHVYKWIKDTNRIRTTTLAEDLDAAETDVTVADASIFKKGDVFRNKTSGAGELFLVVSVNLGTNVITVDTRGTSTDTTDNTNNNGETIEYLYSMRLEGAANSDSPFTVPTIEYNTSQILHGSIKISRSERHATTRYGISDSYKYQLMKWLGGGGGGGGQYGHAGDLMLDLENTFWWGRRIERTTTQPGMMGGFKYFVTTNAKDINNDQLTQDIFEARVQACWQKGGRPNTAIMGAYNKRLVSNWYAPYVTTERSEKTGGVVIDHVQTEFGIIDLMLDRTCPLGTVAICERGGIGWVTLDPWEVQAMGRTIDGDEDQIVGEYGFAVMNEKANAVITNTYYETV